MHYFLFAIFIVNNRSGHSLWYDRCGKRQCKDIEAAMVPMFGRPPRMTSGARHPALEEPRKDEKLGPDHNTDGPVSALLEARGFT